MMLMVFIASEPGWKCKNSSTCPFNKTISLGDKNYSYRCDISRDDWEFTDDFTSVVTEVQLVACSLRIYRIFFFHLDVNDTIVNSRNFGRTVY